MSTVVKKVCTRCAVDVSQTERVKDEAGRYYCRICWNVEEGAVSASVADTSTQSADRQESGFLSERLILAVGAVAMGIVLGIGSYVLYFRDRWERGNRDALLTLVSRVDTNIARGAYRETQPLLTQISAKIEGRTIRDPDLQSQIQTALARRAEVAAGIEKLDQEQARQKRAADAAAQQEKAARIAREQQERALADQRAAQEKALADQRAAEATRLREHNEQAQKRREQFKKAPDASFKAFAVTFMESASKLTTDTSNVATVDTKYSISMPRTNDALVPSLGIIETFFVARTDGKLDDNAIQIRFTFTAGDEYWEVRSTEIRYPSAPTWIPISGLKYWGGFWGDVMKQAISEATAQFQP